MIINMDELLRKRNADLLVFENVEAAYRIYRIQTLTLTLRELSRIIGKDYYHLNSLFNNKLLPEEIIVGGYQNRKQKTKILFDTEMVLKWLRNQLETKYNSSKI